MLQLFEACLVVTGGIQHQKQRGAAGVAVRGVWLGRAGLELHGSCCHAATLPEVTAVLLALLQQRCGATKHREQQPSMASRLGRGGDREGVLLGLPDLRPQGAMSLNPTRPTLQGSACCRRFITALARALAACLNWQRLAGSCCACQLLCKRPLAGHACKPGSQIHCSIFY